MEGNHDVTYHVPMLIAINLIRLIGGNMNVVVMFTSRISTSLFGFHLACALYVIQSVFSATPTPHA